jgi:hypothetical protein
VLGLPALVAFLGYAGLSVAARRPETTNREANQGAASPMVAADLRRTCRAAALVLLTAFWFDGGLFRFAIATVFWMLLELGREVVHVEKRLESQTPSNQPATQAEAQAA